MTFEADRAAGAAPHNPAEQKSSKRQARKPRASERDSAPHAEDLARALKHCEAMRAKCAAYAGNSEHMRRKLEAAVRTAEYDVAILRYAMRNGEPGAGEGG